MLVPLPTIDRGVHDDTHDKQVRMDPLRHLDGFPDLWRLIHRSCTVTRVAVRSIMRSAHKQRTAVPSESGETNATAGLYRLCALI